VHAFVKGIILSFLAHFVKNKKHTIFNRYLDLYWVQKYNENNTVERILYKPKLLHFGCLKCPEQQALLWQNIPRNHGNLDIILIPETRSVSLFTLNNPQGKRAQARAR
jgi:hypothetical protein